jgi:hypothetical protein
MMMIDRHLNTGPVRRDLFATRAFGVRGDAPGTPFTAY